MRLRMLRTVAAVDAANVVMLAALSPRHGAAGAAGYLPALAATIVAHRAPRRATLPLALCVTGLVPNTALAIAASDHSCR